MLLYRRAEVLHRSRRAETVMDTGHAMGGGKQARAHLKELLRDD